MSEHHELMGGKLHIYKRENSRFWQCSTYLAGMNRRMTTKEESLINVMRGTIRRERKRREPDSPPPNGRNGKSHKRNKPKEN
jgi:hypothetical protein